MAGVDANYDDNYLKGCQKNLDALDKKGNGDGKTSIEELNNMSIFGPKYKDLDEKAISIFQQYAQQDGNDEMSAEEYAQALNSNEYNEVLEDWKVREYEKRQELKKNGMLERPQIGLAEPVAYDSKYLEDIHDAQQARDKDGDGMLTVDETLGNYSSEYEDLAKKDREALEKYANADGDKHVSDEEYARWLNSKEHDEVITEYKDREAQEIIEKRKNRTEE